MANFTYIKIWMAAKGTTFELTLGILTEVSFHWDVYSVTFLCYFFFAMVLLKPANVYHCMY